MTHKTADFVEQIHTGFTGTGEYTDAGGTVPNDCRSIASQLATGDTAYFTARGEDASGNGAQGIEVFLGTKTATGLARTTLVASTTGSFINWSTAASVRVSLTAPASRILQLDNELATFLPDAEVVVVPSSGMKLWAANRAGKRFLKMMGPSGLDELVQPSLWGNSWVEWLPGTGTTVSINTGTSWTARNSTGAQSHPATAITNLYTMLNRAEFAAGAVANQSSGIQGSRALFARGNAAKVGGFFFVARFGITAGATSSRFFVGLSSQNAAWTADPSSVNNTCGIGADAADTNLQIITRDGTTASKIDTGIAKTVTSVPFDFYMFCAPNDSKITFRFVRLDTDAVLVNNVEKTTNLPVNTTLLYPWANAASSAAAASTLGLARLYCQADI